MSKSNNIPATLTNPKETKLVARALRCLENHLRYDSSLLNNSQAVSAYLRLQLAEEKNEVFGVLFLNSSHGLLAFEKLFYGTINEATIYPRRVLQKALEHNAAIVILAHNHPSGNCEPSFADRELTKKLQVVLDFIDVRLIDHLIVTHQNTYSFAEHHLL